MKILTKLLKNHNHVVFLDFEGTQYSHEMIAIGAVACSLQKDGHIKRQKSPFKIYVKPQNKIGSFVTKLTGITEDYIEQNGVSFTIAMNRLKKYVGLAFNKASFVTFGSHDITILNSSISHTLNYPKEICAQIHHNYVDYLAFLQNFMRDDNGNPLSLLHYCDAFNVKIEGTAHDPAADALNLAKLYDAFLDNKSIAIDGFKKVALKTLHLPQPIKNILEEVSDGKTVTPKEYDDQIEKYLS